jgi:hypothetical protein
MMATLIRSQSCERKGMKFVQIPWTLSDNLFENLPLDSHLVLSQVRIDFLKTLKGINWIFSDNL